MINLVRLAGIFLVLLTIFACSNEEITSETYERPYDPWVTRSVLDQQPRMITLALDDDLWVAYSTVNCAMYKAWQGHVNFEGAVFNTAHGPQPVTVGDAYLVNTFDHPWVLARGNAPLETTAQYAGHRFVDNHVQLMYDLQADGIDPIRVYEQVEFVGDADLPGLQRIFETENVPDGVDVRLLTNVNALVSMTNLVTDGDLQVDEQEDNLVDDRHLIELNGSLTLNPNATTDYTIMFAVGPTIENSYKQNEEEQAEDLALGYRLIARSDCKTCHNKNVKTIGPAYVEIAERYATTEENVDMLVNKVVKGGAGIWGIQVMSAHPDVPITDVREMVNWILDLDEDENVSASSEEQGSMTLEPATVNADDLLPGAITTVFRTRPGVQNVPPMPGGDPAQAGIMADFANLSGADFVDLAENFTIYGSGYLYFDQAGTYTMRLWSDDGSKLYMNDQLIIDNDGTHSTGYQERDITVEQGYYPFRLEFFQGLGDKFLSLNVRVPVQSEFMTIPSTWYFHSIEDRESLAGYSLPMSVTNRMPGDQLPLDKVHPSYDLFQARPYDFLPKVGGMDVLSDGTVAICTWDATGSVYLVKNPTAAPNDIRVKKIAQGFAEPLGLKVVDDKIYVLQKQELTRLVDTNGDEIIDEYQVVSNHWKTSANFHEFAFGLEHKDGFFYGNLATAIQPGGASSNPQIEDRGKVMKINAQTGDVEFIAHGLRTPNGIGFGVDGELFVSDNQGDWLPSSKILHVEPGVWFGSRSVDFEGTEGLTEQQPVVWLPQDEIGNSPSTPMLLEDGPYAAQMMHGEVTHGGVKRVFVEEINGEYQGCVFRFIQGLEAGVNRMAYGPDGSLYVGGIGNPGNWAQTDKLWYGLQRLKYNGKPTFEMLAIRLKSNGIEIEFTEPLRASDGWDPEEFEIRQWKYVPTKDYGGPKVDDRRLRIVSSRVSGDRRKVFLELEGMQPGHVLYVHLLRHFVSEPGNQLWSTEGWYTMNSIPTGNPGVKWERPADVGLNSLTSHEKADGWRLLFDGKSLNGWKRYRNEDIGKSWIVEDGAIKLNATRGSDGKYTVEDRGDLITADEFENFELSLEWKISNCGNSGIMFSVVESDQYNSTYETGPEYQILDNTCHPDARYPSHRAGDLYDMVESSFETVKPAGEWNQVRLIKKDGKVEHWLNGVKVVEYEMYNDTWDKMVANSKFKDWSGFGKAASGHIALQDHGDAQVWFRDIKLKEL